MPQSVKKMDKYSAEFCTYCVLWSARLNEHMERLNASIIACDPPNNVILAKTSREFVVWRIHPQTLELTQGTRFSFGIFGKAYAHFEHLKRI